MTFKNYEFFELLQMANQIQISFRLIYSHICVLYMVNVKTTASLKNLLRISSRMQYVFD